MIRSVERVVGELSEDERTRIMSDPWTLPEDIAEREQEVLLTRRREEEERRVREQRLAVKLMFQDERILQREKEMRDLQKSVRGRARSPNRPNGSEVPHRRAAGSTEETA